MANIEPWVTLGLQTASTAAFAIPLAGPFIGAAGFAAGSLVQVFWPRPQIDQMKQALQDANTQLSLPTNVDIGTWQSLLNTLSEEMDQANKATDQEGALNIVKLYNEDLGQALFSGDASKIASQLDILNDAVMANQQASWRARFQILGLYVMGATIELQVISQMIAFDLILHPQLAIKDSAWPGKLDERSLHHSANMNQAIGDINQAVLAEFQATAPEAWPIFTMVVGPTPDPVTAATIGMHAPYIGLQTTISNDIKNALQGLANAVQTVGRWSQQVKQWDDAVNPPPPSRFTNRGSSLGVNQALNSRTGDYLTWSDTMNGVFGGSATLSAYAIMQADGNLCIYPGPDPDHRGGEAYWCSGSHRSPDSDYTMIMQADGNLCIYPGTDPDHRTGPAIWASGTNGAPGKYTVQLTNLCLEIRKEDGSSIVIGGGIGI